MSARYQQLARKYEQGDFEPSEDLTPLDDLPQNFCRRVGRKSVGNRYFDAEVVEYVMQHKARGVDAGNIDALSILSSRLFDMDRPEFFELQRDYLTTYAEQQSRSAAFKKGLANSLGSTDGLTDQNFRLLQFALSTLRPDDDEQFSKELYELLTYETLDGRELDDVPDDETGELSPAGRIARQEKENTAGEYSELFCYIGSGRSARADQVAIMSTLFERVPWGKGEWEAFFGYAHERERLRIKQFRALLTAFQQLHDGEEFLKSGESVVAVTDYFDHLQHQPEGSRWGDVPDGKLQSARDGIDTGKTWALAPHFRARDLSAIRRWYDRGGSFRAHELYDAAEEAYDDPEIVSYVLERYDADQSQLNTALKRAVGGLAQSGWAAQSDPFAAVDVLMEAGADPKQKQPSLLKVYMQNALQNEAILPEQFKDGFERIEEISAQPTQLEELRGLYDRTNFSKFGPGTIEAFTPLIQRGIYPTANQLDAIESSEPDLYDQLVDRLPVRKQNAERTRRTGMVS